ncbi:pyruvate/2-oxoglutarate dehydrogenase complex dihydrolipoamide dehydrogenase (E3) component [Geodermatophilus bullaregiensis]|uniref:dihydrolipoyl dehydrogenase family protein n=1 Tax=Geodermatophilus bullaregiensis TaxID=1564160 RepID=UPI00195DEB35|nr:FAD-dependent oxidoreductase [Geodermatophilus bullaregiensis]MBM7808851.1 pyruvate/2-oxoglutarate dehydrogenase complex dihydrolipoamide dehydrogenase (E3) component [Geodermatophilus bullaregiensis]
MARERTWDLAVVGGGTAGLVGARTAAALGARVLLAERDRPGGDCLWTGCVPSKALLAAAARAAEARTASRLGVTVGDVRVDLGAVMAHVEGAVATIEPEDSREALEAAGVTVVRGTARLTGPRTLDLDGRTTAFRAALLATGGRPVLPPVPGLREAGPLTSETVWDLHVLPHRLVVLGGGGTGCELGQAFARLGAQVTLVEALPRVLPGEDPDASALVAAALETDGVRLLTGTRVTAVSGEPGGPADVTVEGPGGRRTLGCDRLLVSVGRRPDTAALDPAAAGVDLDDRGYVRVDGALRTTNPRVWAAGDLTAVSHWTHTAGVHGATAAANAVLGLRRRVDPTAVPRVTFTDPEVAAVGARTWADGEPAPRTVTRPAGRVDRAVAEGRTDGFARLALGPRSRVVGATVVGPRAGEVLAELTLAVRTGLRTADLAATTHPYPTHADGPWNAALDDVRTRLARARPATSALVRLRRLLDRGRRSDDFRPSGGSEEVTTAHRAARRTP